MMTESSGIGDTLAKAIKAATAGKVKPCEGCKKRQEALNRMVPYKRKRKCKSCDKAKQNDD
jgi:flavoprotein